jgi:hypothetical protein
LQEERRRERDSFDNHDDHQSSDQAEFHCEHDSHGTWEEPDVDDAADRHYRRLTCPHHGQVT